MRYDVIVVGAGPAGSTTARECARRGLSVLVLDKAEFPRDKPCGGGVTVKAAGQLPFDLGPVTERVVTSVRFSLRGAQPFRRAADAPLVYLTQRRRLDAFLLEQARVAGAMIREGTPVREVLAEPSRVVVRAAGETFVARAVVVADGANSRSARQVGLAGQRWMTVALEGNVSPATGVPEEWHDAFGFDLGWVPGGYGWLFPKGDHVNIGVWGWTHTGPHLRAYLRALTAAYGFDPAALWGVRGHHLPLRQPGAPLARGGALLVGDAAGFVDPFTGEGIGGALWSGRVAAPVLAAYAAGDLDDLTPYTEIVRREVLPELRVAHQCAELFHLSPRLQVALMRHWRPWWRLFARLARGEQHYSEIRRVLGPLAPAVDLACDFARVTPLVHRYAGPATDLTPRRLLRAGI